MGDVKVRRSGQAATSATSARPAATSTARDLAVTAMILGVAGFMWFGWGQAAPAAGWTIPLAIGSAFGAVVAAAGGVLAWRLRSGASAMDHPRIRRGWFRAVALEVVLIVAGALVLAASGHPAYLPAWTLFAVGVHFFPLARLLKTLGLNLAGVLLVAVAAVAAALGLAGEVPPSTVAGAGGGLICVTWAVSYLRRASRVPAAMNADRAS